MFGSLLSCILRLKTKVVTQRTKTASLWLWPAIGLYIKAVAASLCVISELVVVKGR